MIGLVDHGVEVQAFTVFHIGQQLLPDHRPYAVNVQPFVVVFRVRDTVFAA